ncbi:MAG: ORF6N domain-containing protein [Deferribacterales bacterium]
MSDLIKFNNSEVSKRIYSIRGKQVMLDSELADLYQVQTKRLNEQVKRNIERFPEEFRFQLSKDEFDEVVANCDHLDNLKYSSTLPYAFTEQGVAMLSAVLKSDVAVKISIKIINTFIEMRKFLSGNAVIFQKFQELESRQKSYEHESEAKFEKIFKAIEDRDIVPKQGIFYDGEIFDAYSFVCDLVRKAKSDIVVIDNYIDDTVLTLLSKRSSGCAASIYTDRISKQLNLDIQKHNQQYPAINVKELKNCHDRFIIIDKKEIYHIGASLKDLGKKWFAFSKLDSDSLQILDKIKSIK